MPPRYKMLFRSRSAAPVFSGLVEHCFSCLSERSARFLNRGVIYAEGWRACVTFNVMAETV